MLAALPALKALRLHFDHEWVAGDMLLLASRNRMFHVMQPLSSWRLAFTGDIVLQVLTYFILKRC